MKNKTIIKFFLFLIVISTSNCKDKNTSKSTKNDIEIIEDIYHCEMDSLTLEYLSKTNYSEAIENCKVTIMNREFIIENINYPGLRTGLTSFFSDEELKNNTKVKEVEWECLDGDYIRVWYKQEDSVWFPFDIFKYGKGVHF